MSSWPTSCVAAVSLLSVVGALWHQFDVGQAAVEDPVPTKFRQELVNFMDLQYYGQLTVGGQPIKGVFDTGSVELVVLSENCRDGCGGNKTLYQSNRSQTYRTGSLSLVLAYGSGSLKAREAYESVSVGPLAVPTAPFWEVYDANMPLLFSSDFEAIVGLGPIPEHALVMEPGSRKNEEAFAVLLRKLQVSSFSICLGQDPGSSGFLTWNDDAVDRHEDIFVQVRVADTGYWMLELSGVRLGEMPIDCFNRTCGAVLDSGTSLLALPSGAHDALSSAVAKLEADCSNLVDLPDLHFRLNGVGFVLPPDSYLGQVYGEASDTMTRYFALWGLAPNKSASSSMTARCQAALIHITMESTMGQVWILGMPFFRRFYTVFAQATAGKSPVIHTAPVDDECTPMAKGGSLITRRKTQSARHIDVSKLRIPHWVRRASASGSMDGKLPARRLPAAAGAGLL